MKTLTNATQSKQNWTTSTIYGVLLGLAFLTHSPVKAQQKRDSTYQSFVTNQTYRLLEEAKIFATPSFQAPTIAQLPAGASLVIREKASQMWTRRGVAAHWFQIQFSQKGKQKTGYVWGGKIAIHSLQSTSHARTFFLLGVQAASSKRYQSNPHLQLRVIRDGKEAAQHTFAAIGGLYTSHFAKTLGSKGLQSVQDVLQFKFSDDQCGGAFGKVIVFWDGKKLQLFQRLQEAADAPLYLSYTLIYPSDKNGRPGLIQLISEQGDDSNKVQIEKSEFAWTGTKFILKQKKRYTQTKTTKHQ